MSDTLSPILQWINAHPQFSGLATFIISAAESIAIIGTIIPGTLMMTAIGTLAGMGVIPLWPTLFWAILGAIVGDGISYWVGRYFNTRLQLIWPFRTHPNLLESGEVFFRKHGWMSVFIGRFVGPVRAIVPLIAGMLKMPPLRFTVANVASAIGWAPAYMLPGILLGAASLELPPDIALHVIVMLIATALLILFCIWLIQKISLLINKQIDQMLTWFWNQLHKSSYFSLVTKLLKHHNPKKHYGQLILAFYFLLTSGLLLYLAAYVYITGPQNILINNAFFHFFRSIRTPLGDNIMLAITFLGEKTVLLPLMLTLFVWFAVAKNWRTAWHTLALGIMTASSIGIIKYITHIPRPWGILHSSENFSFPSGHTTLTVVFYLGIVFLLIRSLEIKSRRFIYYCTGMLILAVSISRLYLGAHWVTDIIGGCLLGSAIFMLIALSYNRYAESKLKPIGTILTILLTLLCNYSIAIHLHFTRLKQNYTRLDWPSYTLTVNSWWNQQGDHLPLHRINRFGLTSQILNVQWIGNLSTMQTILLQNGWEIPPKNNWISVLHRISDVESAEHLPLVTPLYLDKKPVLTLVKHVNGNKKLVALRFWNSNIVMQDIKQPLWVGSVEIVPRTYSWLFKQKQNQIGLTSELLFTHISNKYDVKQLAIQINHKTQPLILIKSKYIE
ncbi:MAG: hypothetical protein ACD_45C00561G0002 [uncultured bacterium]|nr:MAG: hypothetical protein ACD_45C00561G0002 [uncultured bacterium]